MLLLLVARPHLIHARSKSRPEVAVKLLKFVDWETMPKDSYMSLSQVINHFLSCPFSPAYNNLIREALPQFAWHINEVKPQEYTIWHSRVEALQRRYFNYLLLNDKLVLALHLACELQSRYMCHTLSAAAEQYDGERARFVAKTARAAYSIQTQLCASPVSVSFV